MKNRKIILVIIGIITILAGVIGISYAYWKSISSQTSSNVLETNCLKLDLIDMTDAINLEKTYPLTDEQASKLTPYEFKISNVCSTDAEFSINLEVMEVENRLNSEYIALSFNNGEKEILGNKVKIDPIYTGNEYTTIEAYNIDNDILSSGEEKTYTLKLWMNETAGNDANTMNKVFLSKITLGVITSRGELATEYITKLADTSEEIVDDETNDHNLRYIGVDPNNYVSFNNELWRIIGVMNDVEDENGVIEPRVKLIRNESIGSYSWDNMGEGSNNWSTSAIKEVLNKGAYYNKTNGNCPNGQNGATTACDFSNIGLAEDAKRMIAKVKWRLGGISSYENNTKTFYINERGTEVYNGRPTEWIGEVGLMYPSDYGYATSGGATTDRNTCINTDFSFWGRPASRDCRNNDWLYNQESQWTIMPDSSISNSTFYVFPDFVASGSVYSTYILRPTIYLSANTKIKSGTGSSTDPYKI